MTNMSLGEMLTNIIFAKIPKLEDIKCSGNWMWSPKLEGEGSDLYKAVINIKNSLIKLYIFKTICWLLEFLLALLRRLIQINNKNENKV